MAPLEREVWGAWPLPGAPVPTDEDVDLLTRGLVPPSLFCDPPSSSGTAEPAAGDASISLWLPPFLGAGQRSAADRAAAHRMAGAGPTPVLPGDSGDGVLRDPVSSMCPLQTELNWHLPSCTAFLHLYGCRPSALDWRRHFKEDHAGAVAAMCELAAGLAGLASGAASEDSCMDGVAPSVGAHVPGGRGGPLVVEILLVLGRDASLMPEGKGEGGGQWPHATVGARRRTCTLWPTPQHPTPNFRFHTDAHICRRLAPSRAEPPRRR